MQKEDYQKIELIKCSGCNGNGSILIEAGINSKYEYCSKCRGVGKVNWIDNIFGRQRVLSSDEFWDRFGLLEKFNKERN